MFDTIVLVISDITPSRRGFKQKRIEPLKKLGGVPLQEQARAVDPSFKTPEQMAEEARAATAQSPILPMVVENRAGSMQIAPTKKTRWWRPQWRWTRLQTIIGSAVAIVLLAGAGTAWMLVHHKQAPVAVVHKKPVIKKELPPPPIYSTLTGLPVPDASVNQRPVTAIMIENSLDARPQSGLSEAGVVFEAIAEGGITRFLAVFQDTAPADIGPIRSARPYYVQWALGFDAAYAHVGGSPLALQNIKDWSVKDMNQFAYGGYYHRITSRAAPHNVYTSMAKLNELEASRGLTSTYTGFARATKDAPVGTPNATAIDLKVSSALYNPSYAYNVGTNSYDRSEGGEAHMDAGTGKQISPKVVIAAVMPLGRGEVHGSGYYSDYQVVGSGAVYIFQNGTVTQGTWTKTANNAQITFTDAAGAAIPLAPGQTWISAVSAASSVSYR